jgi:hypothetical protein
MREVFSQAPAGEREGALALGATKWGMIRSVVLPFGKGGIIGGTIAVIRPFVRKLWAIHEKYNFDNQTLYTGDMGAFNYLARIKFNNQLKHGAPVNTLFKGYELERKDCWFRHK